MFHCPSCGTEFSSNQNFCRNCGEDISAIGGGASNTGLANNIATDRVGEWVNEERLKEVHHLLDEDERVHYMWRGATIDVEGSGAGKSIFGNDRSRKSSWTGIHTGVTNKRIVIAISQFLGDDERHIPYRSATSVDLDTGVWAHRVSIHTKGQTYHISAPYHSKDELREAMQFIRQKIEEANQPQQSQAESAPDPTEQLKNLQELQHKGVITEDEFEAKKQALLNKI
jgi:hypothetical protein